MSCRVFIAASVDGYIAEADGGVGWLDVPPPPVLADGAPDDAGWGDFMAGVDALVMGRGTFEKVLTFGEWPYEVPVVVVSSTLDTVPGHLAGSVEVSSLEPAALVGALAQRGWSGLYIDGGKLITSFLVEGLIDELTITRIPVVLGGGIPLFGELAESVWLDTVSSRVLSNGMVQTTYRVCPEPPAAT